MNEQLVVTLIAVVISGGTALYTIVRHVKEDVFKQFERRITQLEVREAHCQQRLTQIEQENHDLLMRLSGIKPNGGRLPPSR